MYSPLFGNKKQKDDPADDTETQAYVRKACIESGMQQYWLLFNLTLVISLEEHLKIITIGNFKKEGRFVVVHIGVVFIFVVPFNVFVNL